MKRTSDVHDLKDEREIALNIPVTQTFSSAAVDAAKHVGESFDPFDLTDPFPFYRRARKDAPIFYSLYLALITIGAAIVVAPGAPLLGIIFYSQVFNGALLPIVLVLMLLLINNKRLMGTWTNNLAFNVIAGVTTVIVGVLTVVFTAQLIFPSLGG